MKSLNIAAALLGIMLLGAPAAAQLGASPSADFLDAVQKRDGGKATELIENHPTLIDTKDPKGDTALIIALRASDSDWAAFMLKKGADPNLAGSNGDTPLITAAKAGFDEAAEWLIGLGAKVNATNKMGETALIIAVQQRDAPLVKLLLRAGADPDRADHAAGYSARDYATRDSRARDILKLIESAKPSASQAAK